MTTITQLAETIARVAHRGQTRMDGIEPYINHPTRVAERMITRGYDARVIAAALLHDVIEDSAFEAQDLLDLGVPKETVDLVVALTRTDEESYWQYLDRVKRHSNEAVEIKIADTQDNRASLPEGHGLATRYDQALAILRG